MKKTKLFAAIFCGLSLVTASGAILISTANDGHEVANAATTTTIYFTPDSTWGADGASFRVGTTNDFNSAHQMSLVDSNFKSTIAAYNNNTIYSYTFSGSVGNVYFWRTNGAGTEKWNYSNLVSRPSDQYYFIKRDNWWDTWTQDQGTWNNIDTIYTTANQTASASTGRVFLYNSGTSWGGDGEPSVRAWGGDAASRMNKTTSASIYNLKWIQDDSGFYYGYADIPTNVTGFQFILMSGSGIGKSIWNYQVNSAFAPGKEAFSCVYYCGEYAKDNMSISIGGAKDGKAGATLLTKVYEAHYACSANVYNGYPTVDYLNNHFYSHALDGAVNATIDTSYTIKNKHQTMSNMNTSNNGSLRLTRLNDSANLGYGLVIGSISLISILGVSLLVYKKKLEK